MSPFDSESSEVVPPFAVGDRVEFMNDKGELIKGIIMKVWDHPLPFNSCNQRVVIKFPVDPQDPNKGFKESEIDSLRVTFNVVLKSGSS